MIPVVLLTAGLIINVSTLHSKDMNRMSAHATTLLFIALIISSAAATVNSFGGANATGVFFAILVAVAVHVVSACLALGGTWQHRTVGRWPYGRRRATWGFVLNVVALIFTAGWLFLCANPRLYKRFFE